MIFGEAMSSDVGLAARPLEELSTDELRALCTESLDRCRLWEAECQRLQATSKGTVSGLIATQNVDPGGLVWHHRFGARAGGCSVRGQFNG